MIRIERKPSKTELKNNLAWLKHKGYTNIQTKDLGNGLIQITADDPQK